MRYNPNFHPEWGYLAPAPNFIRTARIVFIAVAVGGIAGAGVVLSLVERPVGETSVAARTLARPVEVVGAGRHPACGAGKHASCVPESARKARSDQRKLGERIRHRSEHAAGDEHCSAGRSSSSGRCFAGKVPADEAAAAVKAPVQKKRPRSPIRRRVTLHAASR